MKISLTSIRPWILPISMLCGILFHTLIEQIAFLAPYLIFAMLFITFCRVNLKEFHLSPMILRLLIVQIIGAGILYFAALPLGVDVAQGVFICIFCPTATAAPVITGMLGGSVSLLITYSLFSNIAVAVTAPFIFSLMGADASLGLLESTGIISAKVMPLILLPLGCALLLGKISPKARKEIADHQTLSFYIWAFSLFIVVGRSVSFVMAEPAEMIPEMILIAVMAGLACCLQFYIGRKIGGRYGDKIAGAQGLGQKNTVIAIWMTLTYLNPISSVAPASYIAWQNTINSLQLYFKSKKGTF